MLYRGSVCLMVLAGCQFAPSGETGDDDTSITLDGARDDGSSGGDATAIDAPAAVVDAPIDARPSCPADYAFARNGTRFVRRANAAGIDAARTDCADDLAGRTRLATYEGDGELAAVLDAVSGDSTELWVGARCTYTALGCEGASSWTWDTGGAISAWLWSQSEPNNGFTETSATANEQPQGWTLKSADVLAQFGGRPYVCECAE